jgi:hypothetical protein
MSRWAQLLMDALTAGVAGSVLMFAGLWGISQFTAKPMEFWMAWPLLLFPPFLVAVFALTSSSPPPDQRR